MDALAIVAIALNPILLAVLAYLLKRWIERLEATIRDILKAHGECQLNLAKTYRTKTEAETDSARQWSKIDDHGNRLVRVETMLESDGK